MGNSEGAEERRACLLPSLYLAYNTLRSTPLRTAAAASRDKSTTSPLEGDCFRLERLRHEGFAENLAVYCALWRTICLRTAYAPAHHAFACNTRTRTRHGTACHLPHCRACTHTEGCLRAALILHLPAAPPPPHLHLPLLRHFMPSLHIMYLLNIVAFSSTGMTYAVLLTRRLYTSTRRT